MITCFFKHPYSVTLNKQGQITIYFSFCSSSNSTLPISICCFHFFLNIRPSPTDRINHFTLQNTVTFQNSAIQSPIELYFLTPKKTISYIFFLNQTPRALGAPPLLFQFLQKKCVCERCDAKHENGARFVIRLEQFADAKHEYGVQLEMA
ncbi:hypothetical protein KFK09_024959 [Dendrobium nobile]|uniref:Uncharacterized protein n=1 Tax=Dendrobium nobile TaxID=94219 RepID=A0A8T3AE25_DENNO|nr:hypothetical protein KFK09_024959 [Dendrobium nobile]